ncbi:thioredoxin reductase [Streptomyces sp. CB00455]|uniref:NAD(P)/FAD-dependent oxidoreductase n=1 Tax=Streptomyces sp. CB00455 TaxID=1703927 RepID=UPI00093D287E|nr:NAD(P)/FAD-dependent oxidoreductase [Streptomyces sp. CB00455]OKK22464.1 thioredoxin reductase [Streptomyces sp. CB00455]
MDDDALTNRFDFEVAVVGGGAAGLAGALALVRARRSVLVIDSGGPRNAPAAHVHGYLGLDGEDPAGFLARGRAEVTGYGGRIRPGRAVAADRLPGGGFLVRCGDGSTVRASRLLVATGLVDELPAVPGLRERWGRDVLHCPYCHGWEVRDQAVAVLADGPLAVHQAGLWRQWTRRITLLSHTWRLTDAERELLAARGVAVAEGEVTGILTGADGGSGSGGGSGGAHGGSGSGGADDGAGGGGRARAGGGDRLTGMSLAGGGTVACRALVVAPRFTARSGVLTGLGLPTTALERDGHILGTCVESDPLTGATALPGVWAAGNVTAPMEKVAGAVAQGERAGVAVNADLIEAETARELAAYRAARRADGGAASS